MHKRAKTRRVKLRQRNMPHPRARTSLYAMEWRGQGLLPIQRMGASSDALRPALLVLLALGHDGGAETRAEIFGQFVQLRVAINLDGLLRGVTNHIAVVAPGKMIFQLDFRTLVEDAVQIIGQLGQEFRAFHWLPSPLSRF